MVAEFREEDLIIGPFSSAGGRPSFYEACNVRLRGFVCRHDEFPSRLFERFGVESSSEVFAFNNNSFAHFIQAASQTSPNTVFQYLLCRCAAHIRVVGGKDGEL